MCKSTHFPCGGKGTFAKRQSVARSFEFDARYFSEPACHCHVVVGVLALNPPVVKMAWALVSRVQENITAPTHDNDKTFSPNPFASPNILSDILTSRSQSTRDSPKKAWRSDSLEYFTGGFIWVWGKIKAPEERKGKSILTRVRFWVPIFDPQPHSEHVSHHVGNQGKQYGGRDRRNVGCPQIHAAHQLRTGQGCSHASLRMGWPWLPSLEANA